MRKDERSGEKNKQNFTIQVGKEGHEAVVELSEILRLSKSKVVRRVVEIVRGGPIQMQSLFTGGIVTPSAKEEYRREIAKYVDELLENADGSSFRISSGKQVGLAAKHQPKG